MNGPEMVSKTVILPIEFSVELELDIKQTCKNDAWFVFGDKIWLVIDENDRKPMSCYQWSIS